ncbi:MAG: c-type cytochrome, partial [Candidatus Eremiobacteraeota bacterium]|nr:c-type cytochrome [Candidatus Eremiobacteraeota bacterium]
MFTDVISPASSRFLRTIVAASSLALGIAASTAAASAATGGYSAAQAAQGASVYAANCATCHAQSLAGGSGPALVGAAFHKSIDANYKTAAALYDFISKQMPLSAPGSLSSANYLAVSAYIMKENGYKPGASALSKASAASVKLAMTNENGTQTAMSGQADEIVRAAPPTTVSFGPMPAGANVNVTDDMLGAAEGDAKDWLLGGKSYANDRFSALDQITSANVASLTPVAVVQTGVTASFETTPVVVDGVMYVSTPVVGHQMKIIALNAASGARIWETTYNLGTFKICCGPVNRGVAVAYGKVYFVTLDDKLVSLDATTGKLVFATTVADA